MRCLIDEHVHVDIAELLRRRGHDVVHVAQSPLRHSSDIDLWDVAQSEDRILVTLDLDFPLRNRGMIEGLIILRGGRPFRWQSIISMFERFLDAEGLEAVKGSTVILSPGRTRFRPGSALSDA